MKLSFFSSLSHLFSFLYVAVCGCGCGCCSYLLSEGVVWLFGCEVMNLFCPIECTCSLSNTYPSPPPPLSPSHSLSIYCPTDLGNSTQSSVVMTRSAPLPVLGHPSYPPSDSSPVRSSTDVMSAVVGEVEAALRKLESERRTETVRA